MSPISSIPLKKIKSYKSLLWAIAPKLLGLGRNQVQLEPAPTTELQ